eukprot:15356384-Ditylum_brightwellii.AAC.2
MKWEPPQMSIPRLLDARHSAANKAFSILATTAIMYHWRPVLAPMGQFWMSWGLVIDHFFMKV